MPTSAQTFALAQRHHKAGELAQAEALYRKILVKEPDHAASLHYLGLIAHQTGRQDIAVDLMRRSITLNPADAAAHSNLGNALLAAGRPALAVAANQRAVVLQPELAEAHSNLGNALRHAGRLDDAVAAYRRAIALNSGLPAVYSNLANILRDVGEIDEAIAAYRTALALKPDLAPAHRNLANALADAGQLDDAIASARQAVALQPSWPEARSNLIFLLHFHPDGASAVPEEQAGWNARFGEPLRAAVAPHVNNRDPNRRLRIGYVSGDFRGHVVGWFIEPVLASHNREAFEVFCYSNNGYEDDTTRRLRSHAQHWRPIAAMPDEAAAALIRNDRIDILVDLGMHLDHNRLPLFARKPAPIQVSHMAYPGPTGLWAIDGRFTDALLDPHVDNALLRLPRGWYCYVRPDDPVPPTPARGEITFGSLNNLAKFTAPVVDLWSRILAAAPSASLLLGPGRHVIRPDGVHQRMIEQFQRHGIDPRRVRFAERTDTAGYLRRYRDIDVALDPFPYNGGITTCDALWMGVPVVTLRGTTPVGRMGASILSAVGLGEWIADTADDYVKIAVGLANDAPRLGQLRQDLRARVKASPLTDAAGYTRDIEAAYRHLWRRWTVAPKPVPSSP